MERLIKLLKKSFDKFDLNLSEKKVLTEAASGNYICTPILAALAGAEVYAITKESKYGTVAEIKENILSVAKKIGIDKKISIVESVNQIPVHELDVVTNTGFVRPINSVFIEILKPECVIPLMWEPWEFRGNELDLEAARIKGIKVYGTNENDTRLLTINYLGFIVLYFLLKEKRTPSATRILLIGCEKFCKPIQTLLLKNHYDVNYIDSNKFDRSRNYFFDTLVVAEHTNPVQIVGNNSDALINSKIFRDDDLIIHISGNVDIKNVKCNKYPAKPAAFGYMSYTTDFIEPVAVFDLHAAGLKVAEGMLEANFRKLKGKQYKVFMENNYPALAFDDIRLW